MQIHKFYLLLLFLPLLLPAVSMAQTPDTLYVFRFVSHKDMFYIPWKGNGTQLDHLLSLVENHKAAILSGEAPLLVDGYCASEPTVAENLKLAKIRSNRVKSELILSKGINENCFITRNHAETYGDLRHVVIVRLRLPKDEAAANVKEDSVIPVIKEKDWRLFRKILNRELVRKQHMSAFLRRNLWLHLKHIRLIALLCALTCFVGLR